MVSQLVSGAINWDTSIFVEDFPEGKEEVRATRVISVPGGKGANVAVASGKILPKREVGIIGALGSDEIADRQLQILRENGIEVSTIKRIEGASSGQAYIVVNAAGENFIITHKAANHLITSEMIQDEKTIGAIDESKLIVVIDPPLNVAQLIITKARERRKIVIWSPGVLTRTGWDNLESSMHNVDYVIVNEPEARELTGIDDPVRACSKLSEKLNGKRVIETLGSKGCTLCWQTKVATIPAPRLNELGLEVTNTVGAGDAFLGAFAALKIKEFGDFEALFLANIAGALKTTKEETRASPTYKEIRKYFNDARVQSLFSEIRVS